MKAQSCRHYIVTNAVYAKEGYRRFGDGVRRTDRTREGNHRQEIRVFLTVTGPHCGLCSGAAAHDDPMFGQGKGGLLQPSERSMCIVRCMLDSELFLFRWNIATEVPALHGQSVGDAGGCYSRFSQGLQKSDMGTTVPLTRAESATMQENHAYLR